MAGTLFIVATPIGNLEDLTFRALRTLREVDLIAAEDTRRTSKLLAHYEIQKPLVSVREHNEARESARIVGRLQQGQSVAFVSDAGTPGIADPGARLVAEARAAGMAVVPIPGPSAVTAALSVAGFQMDEFVFMGFPPGGGEARQRWLDRLHQERRTVVFYEAPHRIKRIIPELTSISVKRPIVVFRELSKINEESIVQPSFGVTEKGEFTVVVGPVSDGREASPFSTNDMFDLFYRMTELGGIADDSATALLAAQMKLPESRVKNLIKKGRIARKREAGNA